MTPYTLVEENARISGMLTRRRFWPTSLNMYIMLNEALLAAQTTAVFQEALSHGQVTEKEKALWSLFCPLTAMQSFPPSG